MPSMFDDLIPQKPAGGMFDDLVPAPAPTSNAEAPKEGGGLLRTVDDIMRSVASGMTFGFADELAAGANTLTGMGPGNSYSENVAAERERDKSISPYVRIPGEIGGAIATGTGLAKGGATLMNMARPTVGGMAARGAAEGAAYGAAYGAGAGEGAQGKLEGAAYGAALGAPGGAVLGAVGGKLTQNKGPSVAALKQQAGAAYDAAENAGVIISKNSFKQFAQDVQRQMADEGIDAMMQPRALAALKRLTDIDDNVTLKGAEILRRVVKNAASSNDPSERRMARIMVERLDDYMNNLSPADVLGGNAPAATSALRDARSLWSRASKADSIEELISRARNRSSQFSGSGYENALRTEFRNLAQNAKRLRVYTPDEQAAIRRVANGGPVGNVMRMLGKFAPTGVVSSVLSGGAGFGVGGPVGAVALPALGFAARQGATAATARNANMASALMRGVPPPTQLSPLAQRLLSAGVATEAQLLPQAVPVPSRGR